MPGYLTPAQPTLNAFTPTGNISATTVADAIIELDSQSIRVYSNANARSTAIVSPTEGMVTYLTSTKSLEVYNGNQWASVAAPDEANIVFAQRMFTE